MKRIIDYVPLLSMVQEHISTYYSAALNNTDKQNQLKSYIEKFLRDYEYEVEGLATQELIDKLYAGRQLYFISLRDTS